MDYLIDLITTYIYAVYAGIGDKLDEVSNLIAKAPSEIFAEGFWDNLLKTATLAFMPFSLTLLGFFLASELYEVYCKANGEVDLALVSTTVFRFIIPFFVVLHSYDIIQLIFTSFNGLLSSLSASIVTAMPEPSVDYDAIVASISTYGLLELLACMQQMMGPYIGVTILGGVIYVIVYGRIFEIILYWLVAPLPLATLPSNEYSQIAKNFFKSFAAVMLQGILMMICVAIYVAINWTLISDPTTVDYTYSWDLLWPMVILIFALTKTGTLAKHICGTF